MKGTSWLAAILVIVIGSAVGIAGGTFLAVVLPSMRATHTGIGDMFGGPFQGKGRYVRIMIIGQDNTGETRPDKRGLSDTLVVMAIDTQTKDVRAISIPRDTRIEIPGHGICKINAAHAYGGPELSRQVVQTLLGVPIDYYIVESTSGLRGIVDLLGGVYIIIDKDMHYTDHHQGLYIDLHASPQKQLLNGRQAEEYVRFRHDLIGDSGYTIKDGKKVPAGRIVRQQYFMRALVNRMIGLPTKRDRAKILETAYERKYLVSDLNLKDWDGLADFLKDIKPEKVAMAILPGAPGRIGRASYWLPDTSQIPAVVNTNMLFLGNPDEEKPKVKVLNGSGIVGMAGKVADKLKSAGVDVTRVDNAPKSNYVQSCIIAHKGKTEPVQRIASLLKCDDIREEKGMSGGADVTVIVGRDYSE